MNSYWIQNVPLLLAVTAFLNTRTADYFVYFFVFVSPNWDVSVSLTQSLMFWQTAVKHVLTLTSHRCTNSQYPHVDLSVMVLWMLVCAVEHFQVCLFWIHTCIIMLQSTALEIWGKKLNKNRTPCDMGKCNGMVMQVQNSGKIHLTQVGRHKHTWRDSNTQRTQWTLHFHETCCNNFIVAISIPAICAWQKSLQSM